MARAANQLTKAGGMAFGYARVSTDGQSLDAQSDQLAAAGATKIFAEKLSGVRRDRPQLEKLIEQLRPGDVVVVTKFDRLARSLVDLTGIIDADCGDRSRVSITGRGN